MSDRIVAEVKYMNFETHILGIKPLPAHDCVMVFGIIGHILVKPCGRDKGICHFNVRKLHLCHDQGREGRRKDIKLDRETGRGLRGIAVVKLRIFDGNDIAFLGYDISKNEYRTRIMMAFYILNMGKEYFT